MAGLLTLGSALATEGAKVMSRMQAAGRAGLLNLAANPSAETRDDGLYAIHERPEVVEQRYVVLSRWHLSVFRQPKD